MKWLARSALLMAALSVGGCATAPVSNVTAPAWVASSTASKQQIWGVYDQLAGTTWSAPNSYVLFYRWAVPGQVLVEEFRHPANGELVGTNIIVPGSAPGSLVLTSSIANMQWHGTLDANGNALFARDGMMKMPLRVSRTPAGELLQEKVTLAGAQVVKVDSSTAYAPLGKESVSTNVEAAAKFQQQSPKSTSSTSSTAQYKTLKEGEWTVSKFDDNSLKTSILRRRYEFFTLPFKKDSEVVVSVECKLQDCGYMDVLLEDGPPRMNRIQSPDHIAVSFKLTADNPTLRVEVNGDLIYKISAESGSEGDALWGMVRSEVEAYRAVLAQQKREEESRQASDSAGNALMFNAVMSGLSQGLAEGAADYQASQSNQAALLNNIAQSAQAVQAQQAASAYEEEQVEDTSDEPSSNTQSSTEAEQDATVAAALAQVRQVAKEAGGDPALEAQITDAERALQQKQIGQIVVQEQAAQKPTPQPIAPASPPKQPPALPQVSTSTSQGGPKPKRCVAQPDTRSWASAYKDSKDEAMSSLTKHINPSCGDKGPIRIVGEPSCQSVTNLKGVTAWSCSAKYVCSQETPYEYNCGPGRGSAQ